MTFKEFKEQNGGGYLVKAAEDILGFAKKGGSLYGDCDDLEVVDFLYMPKIECYTVYLAERRCK